MIRFASKNTRKGLYVDFVNALSTLDVEEYSFERAVVEDRLTRRQRAAGHLVVQ